jgi:transcriptional regulator of acetoin/glycerol metabolism
MSSTDATLERTPETDTVQSELTYARRRVAELETELRRLRGEPALASAAPSLTEMRLLDVEGLLVRQAMERHRGNVSRAAKALGLSRSALYRRLERHKI